MPVATVVVPTHDHDPTLRHSVGSALAQTVEDLELIVVGDGAPEGTRELMAELARDDGRVSFLDRPKGFHRGQVHRDEALRAARAEVICYLADDDLWLPTHVEQMLDLLRHADFAAAAPLVVRPSGAIEVAPADLGAPYVRERLLAGTVDLPLSCVAHTLETYRELPGGWRAPAGGGNAHLFMWQRFLSRPGCRAAAGERPTVLNFKAVDRPGASPQERAVELEPFARRLHDAAFQLELQEQALRSALKRWSRCEGEHHDAERHARHLEAQVRELEAALGRAVRRPLVAALGRLASGAVRQLRS